MNLKTDYKAYERYKEARQDRLRVEAIIADQKYCQLVPAIERAKAAGSADKFYGRYPTPRVLIGYLGQCRAAYSPIEIEAYREGYKSETDRKEF